MPTAPEPLKSPSDMTLVEMKQEIRKLCGRVPVSSDMRYLRARVLDLRARAGKGENLHPDPAKVLSVSLPQSAAELVERILEQKQLNTSQLFRRALSEWSKRNGYRELAAILGSE